METRRNYVVSIGAANLDIHAFSQQSIIPHESNPGAIEVSLGGVSRNVSENLLRLGHPVILISAIGDDANGRRLQRECSRLGIDMGSCVTVPGAGSSSYVAIIDDNGDMAVAISDMRILDHVTPDRLAERASIIDGAEIIATDASMTTTSLRYILERWREKRVFIDPVSVRKCTRIESLTDRFYCMKMNRAEAEYLSGVTIGRVEDSPTLPHDKRKRTLEAGRALVERGIGKVFITAGAAGAFYFDSTVEGHISAPACEVNNATGAGDAFLAAVVHAELEGHDTREAACLGVAAATVALGCRETVSPEMSRAELRRRRNDM